MFVLRISRRCFRDSWIYGKPFENRGQQVDDVPVHLFQKCFLSTFPRVFQPGSGNPCLIRPVVSLLSHLRAIRCVPTYSAPEVHWPCAARGLFSGHWNRPGVRYASREKPSTRTSSFRPTPSRPLQCSPAYSGRLILIEAFPPSDTLSSSFRWLLSHFSFIFASQ